MEYFVIIVFVIFILGFGVVFKDSIMHGGINT